VPTLHGISNEHYAMHATQLFWPVRCTACSCRLCTMHGVHSTEKVPFLNWL